MSHYFENDKNLPSQLKRTVATINGKEFIFYTDNGVFSKTGLDFGSRLLLESIPIADLKGKILDVGCGYGPLGIVINKLSCQPVEMVDINRRALHLAQRNSKENNCTDIRIYESSCYEAVTGYFDIIVTNPPIRAGKKIVYEILFGAKEHLKQNGVLFCVIRKDQGAKSIISDLEKAYNVTILKKSKGFFIIQAKNG